MVALCVFLAAAALLTGCPEDAGDTGDNGGTAGPGDTADTTAPAEVTLMVGAGTASGSVVLSWSDPADDDFLYVLISWAPAGGAPDQPHRVEKGTQTATVTGLADGTYTFIAVSVDSAGNMSTAGTASTSEYTIDTTAPAGITALAAGPGSNSGSVVLSWSDPADDDFSHVLISWTPAGGTTTQPLRVNIGTETAAIEGLTDGVTYTVTAVSVDNGGNQSAASMDVTVIADAAPPALATAVAATQSDGTAVVVTWVDPADDDFSHALVTWEPTGGTPAQPLRVEKDTQTATISGLAIGAEYTFSIKSVDNLGHTSAAASNSVTVANTAAPAQVSNFGGHPNSNGTSLRVFWTDPDDTDFAKVIITYHVAVSSGTPQNVTQEVDAGVETILLSGLSLGSTYVITATSVDNASPANQSAPTSELRIGIGPYVAIWRVGAMQGNFGFDACANSLSGDTPLATNLRNRGITKGVLFGSTDTYDFVDMETDEHALPGSGSSTVRTYRETDGAVTEAVSSSITFSSMVNVASDGAWQSGRGDLLTPLGVNDMPRSAHFWSFTHGQSYAMSSCEDGTSSNVAVLGSIGNIGYVDGVSSSSQLHLCSAIAILLCAGQ